MLSQRDGTDLKTSSCMNVPSCAAVWGRICPAWWVRPAAELCSAVDRTCPNPAPHRPGNHEINALLVSVSITVNSISMSVKTHTPLSPGQMFDWWGHWGQRWARVCTDPQRIHPSERVSGVGSARAACEAWWVPSPPDCTRPDSPFWPESSRLLYGPADTFKTEA